MVFIIGQNTAKCFLVFAGKNQVRKINDTLTCNFITPAILVDWWSIHPASQAVPEDCTSSALWPIPKLLTSWDLAQVPSHYIVTNAMADMLLESSALAQLKWLINFIKISTSRIGGFYSEDLVLARGNNWPLQMNEGFGKDKKIGGCHNNRIIFLEGDENTSDTWGYLQQYLQPATSIDLTRFLSSQNRSQLLELENKHDSLWQDQIDSYLTVAWKNISNLVPQKHLHLSIFNKYINIFLSHFSINSEFIV